MADRSSFEQTPYELPPGATEIVMVRHGASSPPIEGIPNPLVGGHSNPALAEPGKAQAELVAEGLRHEPISAIFVSTLRRTAETAAPLLSRSTCTSSPARWNAPVWIPHRVPTRSASGVPATRTLVRSAASAGAAAARARFTSEG